MTTLETTEIDVHRLTAKWGKKVDLVSIISNADLFNLTDDVLTAARIVARYQQEGERFTDLCLESAAGRIEVGYNRESLDQPPDLDTIWVATSLNQLTQILEIERLIKEGQPTRHFIYASYEGIPSPLTGSTSSAKRHRVILEVPERSHLFNLIYRGAIVTLTPVTSEDIDRNLDEQFDQLYK